MPAGVSGSSGISGVSGLSGVSGVSGSPGSSGVSGGYQRRTLDIGQRVDYAPAVCVICLAPCVHVQLREYLGQIDRRLVLAVGIHRIGLVDHYQHRQGRRERQCDLKVRFGVEHPDDIGHRQPDRGVALVGYDMRQRILPRGDAPQVGVDVEGIRLQVGGSRKRLARYVLVIYGDAEEGVVRLLLETRGREQRYGRRCGRHARYVSVCVHFQSIHTPFLRLSVRRAFPSG